MHTADATNVIARAARLLRAEAAADPAARSSSPRPTRAGSYLDVTKDDLEVLEDGVPQKLETFQEAVQDVSIVLALDSSGSMKKSEADVIAQRAGVLSRAAGTKDQLALLTFGDKVVFAHDLSTQPRLQPHARSASTRRSAAPRSTTRCTTRCCASRAPKGRRVVVVMTDGRDENNAGNGPGSTHTFAEVLKLREGQRRHGLRDRPRPNLDKASSSRWRICPVGGRSSRPTSRICRREYRRVIDDLRRRYVLGYTSTHIQRDGSWRKVEIQHQERADCDDPHQRRILRAGEVGETEEKSMRTSGARWTRQR